MFSSGLKMNTEIKIGILTNAYREEHFIQGCITQFLGRGFLHIVLNSSKPWNGESSSDPDNTFNISNALGARAYRAPWEKEEDQYNFGLSILESLGYDWVLIVDADERYTNKDLDRLITCLNELNESNVQAVKPNTMHVYWKSPDYRIIPDQVHRPVIAVRPQTRFINKRENNGAYCYIPVELHHFSYVRTNDDMLKKIQSFSHSDEIVDGWYEKVWRAWTPKSRDIHPTVPTEFWKAIKHPCPEELLEHL